MGGGYGRDDHCLVQFVGSSREGDGPFGRSTDAVDERGVLAPNGTEAPDGEGDAAPYRETRRSKRHTPCWTPGRNPMTDAGLMGKASIDWDHLDATDSTGQLGSLINLARPRGFHVAREHRGYSPQISRSR